MVMIMRQLLTSLTQAEKQLKEWLLLYGEYGDKYSLNNYLLVSIAEQTLFHIQQKEIAVSFPVSTAENGVGCEEGSEKTPLGVHRIAEKIGDGVAEGSLFKAREVTGEVLLPLTKKGNYSEIDAITSRILWLDGLDLGKNKEGNIDSYRRYIYIHGTNEEWRLGTPVSHGCIRMSNRAIIDLYDTVCVNTLVVIV